MEYRLKILEEKVEKIGKNLKELYVDFSNAFNYIQSDPNGSLNKSRIVLEKILIDIFVKEMGVSPRKKMIAEILRDNQFTRKIDRRILSRMHSIRDMANLGTHGELVNDEDAIDVLESLCRILKWYFEKYGKQEKAKKDNKSKTKKSKVSKESKKKSEKFYEFGSDYYKKENYQLAIENFTKAISLNPYNTLAYFDRANTYKKLNKYINAIEDYTKASDLSSSSSVYFLRALTYEKIQDYENAILDYTNSIEIEPDDDKLYQFRGQVYEEIKDYENAIKDYLKCAELTKEKAIPFYKIGHIYYMADNHSKAIDYLNKAISHNEYEKDAFYERAESYLHLKEYDKCIRDATRYIELDPMDPNGYRLRGVAHRTINNFISMWKDFNKMEKLEKQK